MKKPIEILVIICFLLAAIAGIFFVSYGVVYSIMDAAPQENETRVNNTVKAVCGWANEVQSDAAYKACGKAQDASMTEYLCREQCWVEDKRDAIK